MKHDRVWLAQQQKFNVNITVKTTARSAEEARAQVSSNTCFEEMQVEHVVREDLRGRGELSFQEELDQLGGKRIWNSMHVRKENAAYIYKRRTLKQWQEDCALFEATEQGADLLQRCVSEVWEMNTPRSAEVWVKMSKTVRRG